MILCGKLLANNIIEKAIIDVNVKVEYNTYNVFSVTIIVFGFLGYFKWK